MRDRREEEGGNEFGKENDEDAKCMHPPRPLGFGKSKSQFPMQCMRNSVGEPLQRWPCSRGGVEAETSQGELRNVHSAHSANLSLFGCPGFGPEKHKVDESSNQRGASGPHSLRGRCGGYGNECIKNPQLIHDHCSQAIPTVKSVEGGVGVFDALESVGDEMIKRELSVADLDCEFRNRIPRLPASEGCSFPSATSHQLEWACCDFLAAAGDADHTRTAPSAVGRLEGDPHHINTADAFEGVVKSPGGESEDLL